MYTAEDIRVRAGLKPFCTINTNKDASPVGQGRKVITLYDEL